MIGLATSWLPVNCIHVQNGAALKFATLAMNREHNGSTGAIEKLCKSPEIVADFDWCAAHVEAVLGQELTRQFYGEDSKYNYYGGCSTTGRQGFTIATPVPGELDGRI